MATKASNVSPIEQAVRDATGVEPKRGEARADYLARLTDYLDDDKKFTDKDWKELSDADHAWVNAACTAKGKNQPIPEFPDVEPAEAPKDKKAATAETAGDDSEEKAVATSKTSKAIDKKGVAKATDLKKAAPAKEKKKAAPKATAEKKAVAKPNGNGKADKAAATPAKEKKAKVEKAPKEKKAASGKSAELKAMILSAPETTNKDLLDKMTKAGHKITMSTLSTIRSGFLHSMSVIEAAGRLKPAPRA